MIMNDNEQYIQDRSGTIIFIHFHSFSVAIDHDQSLTFRIVQNWKLWMSEVVHIAIPIVLNKLKTKTENDLF